MLTLVDLLAAIPSTESAAVRSCIRGKACSSTGAGGSIGSELCRQIMQLSPQPAWSCSRCRKIASLYD